MCFDADALPPDLPADLVLPPIAGGAKAEELLLTSSDGTEFSAAFAPAAQSRGAAVVILPDVRGLYGFYVTLAERFAAAGHDAVAIDYFGRTAGTGLREPEWDYWPHVAQIDFARLLEDMRAAKGLLETRVTPDNVATVGFCLGGTFSLMAAADDDLDLDRAASFYGVLRDRNERGFYEPLAHADEVSIPVLALYGGADEAIPVEDVEEYEAALRGDENEFHVYPGAPHSFFDRKQEEFAEASEDAWRRTLRFLSVA